jgi:DNA invertase Pin-like site-specific DNA recombinase
MSERRAKRLRREARERGDLPHVPVYNQPTLLPIKNDEGDPVPTYVPRNIRRKMVRMFLTDYRKGRLQSQKEAA